MHLLLTSLIIFFYFSQCGAQNPSTQLSDYGPSEQFPFGHLNPNAPEETKQFDFMIGEFDRVDSLLDRTTGVWNTAKGEWNAQYFMNGQGIQDQSWNIQTQSSTTNIRIFDSNKQKWVVTWMKLPGYKSVVSEGQKEGERIVIKNFFQGANGPVDVEYVFYDIQKDSYKWIGYALVNGQQFPFWKISCQRKTK